MVATFSVATINQINVNAKNTSSQSNPSSSKANFSSSSDLSKASSSSSSESSTSDLTKTKTKAKLKLDATHPKFLDKANPEVTKLMQDAILKTLKKWKGELPIDNTFTITSWSKLKSDTTDSQSQHKKKKATTPNSWVIYMWSQTPNTNWSKDKAPTDEDRES